MADILIVLAYVEIGIVVLALISNSLLTYIIATASSLHYNCRGLLLQFSFSMYLLTTSHGLTVFEFLYEKKSYEYIYSVSIRGVYWRMIHEFGYCFQSISLVLFSIERLIASICPMAYRSIYIKILFVTLSIVSMAFSVLFTLLIHLYREMFWPTVPMNVIDISGCIILLIAWRRSLSSYRTTVGVYSLEQRFQLSEVYTWSRHLIPAVLLASFTKLIVIGVIWITLTGSYTGNEAAFLMLIYNNILNIYTMVLPFVIMMKHDKVRNKVMQRNEHLTAHAPKTLDGRVIPSKHDYFEHLNWK